MSLKGPLKALVSRIQREKALDKISAKMTAAVDAFLAKPANHRVKAWLQGSWLGHPLHPALTDIPLGAWSCAAAADLMSIKRAEPFAAATLPIGIGVAGASAAAVSGLMDWHDIDDVATRRIGTTHAALNSAALLLYAVSFICRTTHRGPARLLAFTGFGISNISAYLGGELVFGEPAGMPPAGEVGMGETSEPASAYPDGGYVFEGTLVGHGQQHSDK